MPSPEDAAWGGLDEVTDDALPGIAAQWLVDGFDSDCLRQVAAMSACEGHDARTLMPTVLESIGHPLTDGGSWDRAPWRGHWAQISWAIREIDNKLSPYAAAQRVLEVLGDVPELWEPGRGPELETLLRAWDDRTRDRMMIAEDLRNLLRSMHRDDIPPLLGWS